MRAKSVLICVAAAFLLAGCETDKPRAYKMHQTSGRMTRGSDIGYPAICKTLVPGSHAEFWTGQSYPEKELAMRNAVRHNQEFPGHDATIEH